MKQIKLLKKHVITFYITVRHGINPFKSVVEIANKLRDSLTDREKLWIANNCESKDARDLMLKILNIKKAEEEGAE